jgi:hypothetical protein
VIAEDGDPDAFEMNLHPKITIPESEYKLDRERDSYMISAAMMTKHIVSS